jgi:hypothetical protein
MTKKLDMGRTGEEKRVSDKYQRYREQVWDMPSSGEKRSRFWMMKKLGGSAWTTANSTPVNRLFTVNGKKI